MIKYSELRSLFWQLVQTFKDWNGWRKYKTTKQEFREITHHSKIFSGIKGEEDLKEDETVESIYNGFTDVEMKEYLNNITEHKYPKPRVRYKENGELELA